jgi:prevent-host-death family protein
MEYHRSMAISVSATDAKNDFEKLLAAAVDGDEVIIERDGRPVARLVGEARPGRLGRAQARRQSFGVLEGKYRAPDDFNDPLPDDVLDLFEAPLGPS